MAIQDARLSFALFGHPKYLQLASELGDSGGLALVRLILWTGQNRPDGDLSRLTDRAIETAVGWSGAPGMLAACLAQVGFLDGPPERRRVHDWEEHQPWLAGAKRRSEAARQSAMQRHHGQRVAAERMRGAEDSQCETHKIRNAPSPSPSPSSNKDIVLLPKETGATADPIPVSCTKCKARAEVTTAGRPEACHDLHRAFQAHPSTAGFPFAFAQELVHSGIRDVTDEPWLLRYVAAFQEHKRKTRPTPAQFAHDAAAALRAVLRQGVEEYGYGRNGTFTHSPDTPAVSAWISERTEALAGLGRKTGGGR